MPRALKIGAELLETPPEGLNVGLFLEAPEWKNPDYFAFLIL